MHPRSCALATLWIALLPAVVNAQCDPEKVDMATGLGDYDTIIPLVLCEGPYGEKVGYEPPRLVGFAGSPVPADGREIVMSWGADAGVVRLRAEAWGAQYQMDARMQGDTSFAWPLGPMLASGVDRSAFALVAWIERPGELEEYGSGGPPLYVPLVFSQDGATGSLDYYIFTFLPETDVDRVLVTLGAAAELGAEPQEALVRDGEELLPSLSDAAFPAYAPFEVWVGADELRGDAPVFLLRLETFAAENSDTLSIWFRRR